MVTAIDGLVAGQAGPLLPVGSGLSLAAAGMILIFWRALAPLAARLAALIFATWAIVLKAPLIASGPGNEYAWIGFVALMGLAAIGTTLRTGQDDPDAAQDLLPAASLWPQTEPAARSLPGYQGPGR